MRLCEVEGCGRKHVAKGMCVGHYNRTHYTSEQRHPKVPQPCHVCGTITVKHRVSAGRRVVCSYECRYILTWGHPKPKPSTELVGPLPRPERITEAPVMVIASAGRVFISAECQWCAAPFVQDTRITGVPMRYCSRRCARAKSKNLRNAREHGATGTYTLGELVRLWLAFGKCCAYCEQPTNGLPDPDHVNPLSRGGSNSITNILPACRDCNADKNDMSLSEWALDRNRRGKAPRTTSWAPSDARVAHLVLSEPTRPSRVGRLAA